MVSWPISFGCAGLPEEVQIVAAAVQRQYAVVTVGQHLSGEATRCWQKTWPPEAGIEMPEVQFKSERFTKLDLHPS